MPITYNEKEEAWVAHDLSQEEISFLVEVGKEELLKLIALQMFRKVSVQQMSALDDIPKEAMGSA